MMEEVPEIISKVPAEDSGQNSGSPSDIDENPPARVTESLGVVPKKSSPAFSDEENDILVDKPRNGKRSRAVFDSDSEDNISNKGGSDPKADDSDEDTFDRIKKTKNGFSRVKIHSDSDSDDDDNAEDDDSTLVTSGLNKKANKISSLIDSESEEEEAVPEKKSKKSKSGKSMATINKITSDSDSDHDDDDKNDNKSTPVTSELQQKSLKISSLIDSESEEDTPQRNDPDPEEQPALHENPKKSKSEKSGKSKNMSKRAAKDEALKQIRSETQRMIRESSISLPYHRPKQRTLQDFLNRKKVAPSLPEAPTTKKLKISAKILNKVLEEKEKEAEKFYKSSDSEEELEEQKTGVTVPINPQETQKISIEDTQKLLKSDLHNRQNVINDASQGFGVARKLLMDEASPALPEPSADTLAEINGEGLNMSHKEFRRNLKDVSIPRKLFNRDFEDGADTIEENLKVSPLDSGISSTDTQESGSEDIPKPSEAQKSSENHSETLGELSESLKTQIFDEKLEDVAISETPMVSNKEFMKLNARNSISNNAGTIDGDDELDGHILGLPLSDDEPEESSNKIDSITCQLSVNPTPTLPSIKKAALLNINNVQPKFRGNPGMIIDLNKTSKPDKAAIDSLVDRFLTKHSAVSQTEDKTSEITILNTEITPEGLKISKDTLPYKIRSEKFEDSELNKPGAKLIKLKEELEKKMADKRYEEWKQKEKEMEDDDCDEIDEFEDVEKEEKIIDDDDDDDEEESEPEEDDVIIEDKKRKTHEFDDDEAEVSEEDNMELSGDESDNESSGEPEEDFGDDQDDHQEQEDLEDAKSKKFSRIVQIDSDSEEENTESINKNILKRMNTDRDMFADDDDVGDCSIGASQSCKTPLGSSKPLSLISPLSESNQIASQTSSALKNNFSNTQMSDFSPLITMSNSPIESSGELENVKSKLFNEETSPVDDEDLLDLCSGKFPDDISSQTSVEPNLKGLVDSSPSGGITESQLMNLCSGTFATQFEAKIDDAVDTHDDFDDFKLTFDDCAVELDKNQKSGENDEEETVIGRLDIASSSDDEEEAQKLEEKTKKLMKTKKKVKKLVLSDDEDENNDRNEYSDEESNAEVESEEEKFVDYDSEENEVITVSKKDLKKVAANYLEEEAELSESEWGSEDEDERDLDNYEMEVADSEEIDESLMRDQIGKIHARQLLDEDNRDVRMLKEMLFDDGDLHEDGNGRERKFRWKNIDKVGLESVERTDDDGGVEEEQNDAVGEVEWRKLRMEREKFLKEKKKENEIDGDGDLGVGLFGLGLKALKRNSTIEVTSGSKNRTILPRSVPQLMQCSSKTSLIVNTVSKRGSFLTRGDASLAIIAGMTKQTEVTLAPVKAGNFLFTHLSPSVSDSTEVIEGENESSEKSKKIVRKRKSTDGQTPKNPKKAKIEIERSSAKKLF